MSRESFSEERFRRLVEVAPDGVLLYADGRLLFVNPAGVRLLGATSTEGLVGRPIADFVEPSSRAMVEDEIDPAAGSAGLAEEKMVRLVATLDEQFKKSKQLEDVIRSNLATVTNGS